MREATPSPSTAPPATRRIVFGDDGSPGADVAWLWISSQRWTSWSLDIVRVEPSGWRPVDDHDCSNLHADPQADRRVVFDECDLDEVRYLTAVADPRVVLLQSSGDLMVVGSAASHLGPFHVGSTTEWLLERPPTPLVVARSGRPVKRAVVCTDGSAHARRAAEVIASLPWVASTSVTILAADDGHIDPRASAREVAELFETSDVVIEPCPTKPHKAILAHLDETPADLVVLGTRGRSALPRALMGSTARSVSRHAPCSVLVAHATH